MFQRSQICWTQSAFGVRFTCSILVHHSDFVDARQAIGFSSGKHDWRSFEAYNGPFVAIERPVQ